MYLVLVSALEVDILLFDDDAYTYSNLMTSAMHIMTQYNAGLGQRGLVSYKSYPQSKPTDDSMSHRWTKPLDLY